MLIFSLAPGNISALYGSTESGANKALHGKNESIEKCIEQLALGDKDAMTELYSLVSSGIYAFSLSILKNRHDAEDVLHDCFIQIYSAAESYRPEGKPMAWIMTIARNLCYKRLRGEKPLSLEDSEPSEESCPSHESRLIIKTCLNELGDEERQIVVLHAVSGFKHREIAAFLELPLPTVLSKYNRALKKLRKILEEGE